MRELVSEEVQRGDRYFRWRGGNVSRLEGIFDAVMALAITMIVFSIEVPQSFDDLIHSFQRLPAFAIGFAILIMCWYYHFLFHRRFGLEDSVTVFLNAILMFLVVFYVYPLKFVYTLLFASRTLEMQPAQMPTLMVLYSSGFLAIFVVLGLLYGYAHWKRAALNLNFNEIVLTRMKIGECFWHVLIAGISIGLALLPGWLAWSGLIYFSIPVAQFANGLYWGRQIVD